MNVTEQTRKVKVINRRIKQVETRIQREVVVEDGKVIQDSGPKVTTKTIEDYDTQEIEESEDIQNASHRSVSPVRQYFFGECPSHYKNTFKTDRTTNRYSYDKAENVDKNNNVSSDYQVSVNELDRQLPVEYSNFTKVFSRH